MTSMIQAITLFAVLMMAKTEKTTMLYNFGLGYSSCLSSGSKDGIGTGYCIFQTTEEMVEFLTRTEQNGVTKFVMGFSNTIKEGYVMGLQKPTVDPVEVGLVQFVNESQQYWIKEGTNIFTLKNEFSNLCLGFLEDKYGNRFLTQAPCSDAVLQRWQFISCSSCPDSESQKSAEDCVTQEFKFLYRLKTGNCMSYDIKFELQLDDPCYYNYPKNLWEAVDVRFSDEGINYFLIYHEAVNLCLSSVDESDESGNIRTRGLMQPCNELDHKQLWQFIDGATPFFFGLRQFQSMKCLELREGYYFHFLEPCDSNNMDLFTGVHCEVAI